MRIFYFYIVCFTFSIFYSVLPFHLVYVFQFLHLFFFFFFFDVLYQACIKHSRKVIVYIYRNNMYNIYILESMSQTQLSDFTSTFHFHALEKEMATHSSVLAWRIPGTGEPGGLLSLGSHRVGHDWSDLTTAAESMNFYLSITSWTSLVNVKKKSIIPETVVFIHLIRVSLLSVLADLLSY